MAATHPFARALRRIAAIALALTIAAPAHATPADEAATHYADAMAAMERGDLGAAARSFDAAYALSGSVALVWNAARAYHQNDELELALERYATCRGDAAFPAAKREKLDAYVLDAGQTLEARRAPEPEPVPEPEPEPEPEPAPEPAPSATPTPATPPAPAVTPTAPVTVPEPEPTPWAVAVPAPTTPNTASRAYDPGTSDSAVTGWILAGTGLVIAGTGLGLHYLAEGQRDDVRRAVAAGADGAVLGITQRDAHEQQSDADTMDTIGVASIAVGGTAVLAGIVMLIVDATDDDPATDAPGGAALSGSIGPDGASVSAGFSF